MAGSKYSAGYRFECATRDNLRDDGYEVIRSAGSKGKIDIVAMKSQQLLFVQCKLNGLCPPSERKEIIRLARLVNAFPIVAYQYKEGRAAAEVRYRRLTGSGPHEFEEWNADVDH